LGSSLNTENSLFGRDMMKKLLISVMIILSVTTYSMAAEKRPIKDVESDAITDDTQVTAAGAGDNHVALTWWIPNEFWESVLPRDTSTSETSKRSVRCAHESYIMLECNDTEGNGFRVARSFLR